MRTVRQVIADCLGYGAWERAYELIKQLDEAGLAVVSKARLVPKAEPEKSKTDAR